MDPLPSASPSTTVDSLLASLKMDSRIQALQYRAISLQHTLRKMAARPDLKAPESPAPSSVPQLPPVVAAAPPPSPAAMTVVRSSLLDDNEYDDLDDQDDDDTASESDAYYSLYDDYGEDEEITFEKALPSPITTLGVVRYMSVTRITTGPRIIDVPRTPSLSPASSAASSPSRSSSASSLPQPRSSTSSHDSWTSSSAGTSVSSRTSKPVTNTYADWSSVDSRKLSSPGGAPVTSPVRVRNLSYDERAAKHARRRSLIKVYLENLAR